MSAIVLEQLINLSRHLGDPARDYAILGEGNTSVRVDDGSFWVKASGKELRTADAGSFVQVVMARALAMLDLERANDDAIRQALMEVRVDPASSMLPSVETVMHAVCLGGEGVSFIGHTHPSVVNMLTCSKLFASSLAGRLFPDEIVLCGPAPLLVEYVDPGLPLALEVQAGIKRYTREYGHGPKVIYLQNHGMVALGGSAREVQDITAMAVKAAGILVGTYSLGGPNFLSGADVRRIHDRPDEHHRQRMLADRETNDGC